MGTLTHGTMKAVFALFLLLSLIAFGKGKSNKAKLFNEKRVTLGEASDGRKSGKEGKNGMKTQKGKSPIKKKTKTVKKPDSSLKKSQNRQTCGEGVTAECLANAKDVMFFEAYQRNNFLKQFTRFVNQNRTSDNKLGKRGIFEAPRKLLAETAGGNISDVRCESNTTCSYFMGNYTLLLNCSDLVVEKCNISGPDPADITAMTKCNVEMEKTKTITGECQKFSKDGTAQCSCWASAKTDHMEVIKALRPKCSGMSKIAKDMKQAKNTCIDQFTKCKKAEDSVVHLIGECMDFATQDLNQTHMAGQAGAEIIG